jgi:RNA polymerase sigma factor (sigma-70 family)
VSRGSAIEDLLREFAPQVLAALTRRYGGFDAADDAVQEAMIAASTSWRDSGIPENPRGWLYSVATRKLIDGWRSDSARSGRERRAADLEPVDDGAPEVPAVDDSLTLLFLCCHPALSQASQLALTLRAVGGLSTSEIARAFLVPESTLAQRISRAKQQLKAAGLGFELPADDELSARLAVVLQVVYLIFNEGYTPGSRGPDAADLTAEAIRLARMLSRQLPAEPEVSGLLALLLLTEARRPARTTPDGLLVPLAEQDRALWDAERIREGTELVTRALGSGRVGVYQPQAAIAALHDEAPTAGSTDWPQILALYDVLEQVAPSPVVTLNRAVAVAQVHGPRAGLAVLGTVSGDPGLGRSHRLDVVRGHLLELAGDVEGARESYRRAMAGTVSAAERHHLALRVAELG